MFSSKVFVSVPRKQGLPKRDLTVTYTPMPQAKLLAQNPVNFVNSITLPGHWI